MRNLFLILALCYTTTTVAHPSWGIVVADDGNIYFTDVMHHTDGGLCRIDTTDYHMTVIQDDMHAHALFADSRGNLWAGIDIWRTGSIEGEGHHYLVKYDIAANKLDTLLFTDDEDYFFGNNIATDPNNNVYFTIHNKVFKNDLQGNTTLAFSHEFKRVNTLAIDKQGNLWITDKEQDNGSLYRWNEREGLTLWAKKLLLPDPEAPIFEEERHQIFYAIGFDADGTPLVCDNTTRKLRRITQSKVETIYRSEEYWHPTGVYYAYGKYYVMESGYNKKNIGPRITILDKNYTKTALLEIDADKQEVHPTFYNTGDTSPQETQQQGKLPIYLLPLFIVGIIIGAFRKKIFPAKK